MTRSMLCAVVLLAGGVACGAQTGAPIRSLPKAPGDTSSTQPDQPVIPPASPADTSVAAPLNITPVSPAPPAETSPAAYAPAGVTTPIPAMGSEVLAPKPAAPAEAAPSTGAPVNLTPASPTYAQPGQQPVTQATPGAPSPAQPITPYPVSDTPAPANPDMGPAPLHGAMIRTDIPEAPVLNRKPHFGPFSALGVQVKGGFAGVGIDLATPLAQRLNLRVGASFFQYNGSYDIDGMHVDGTAKFRSGTVQFDIFPFGNGFRISPGVTVYNGNNLNANLLVPAGDEFDLGDASFTSGCDGVTAGCGPKGSNPVSGTMSMTFGNRTAPSLTVGWGNMIPRSNRHVSFPFEIGVQYIQDPLIHLYLSGIACGSNTTGAGCTSIQSDPESQQDLKDEENDINNDIRPLRFYPIVSFGVAWAFHIGNH